MGEITFNGVTSTSVGIQVAHSPRYVYPEKDSEAVHVPGRNGDIIIDKDSYKNVPREYEITVYDQAHPEWTYSQRVVKLSNWLHSARGYAKLSDTYDVGYFRKARYVEEAQEIENFINQGGAGTITFDCRPERFLVTGDNPITKDKASSGTTTLTIQNPTQYYAKPYIKLYGTTGSGNTAGNLTGTLRLNTHGEGVVNIITVTGAQLTGGQPYLIVDSELQIVNSNSDSPFTYTLHEGFPILAPPDPDIANQNLIFSWVAGGNISKIEVIPRWYII